MDRALLALPPARLRDKALQLALLWGAVCVPAASSAQQQPAPAQRDEPLLTAQQDELEELEELEAMMDEVDAEAQPAPQVASEGVEFRTIEIDYTPEEIAKQGGSVQVLDQEDLEAFAHDDVHDVVTQAAGVYVREEDGFGLRPNIGIRGANSERSKKITLAEDGVLFGPAPYSAPAAYYFPMMHRVTGVEVFKGPGSIIFGPQTIGGALNFTTRAIDYGHQGGATLGLGAFPTAKLHAWHSYGGARFGLLGEAVHLRSAGFKTLDGGGDTGFERSEAMLKAHLNSDPLAEIFHRLSFKGVFSQERSSETYLGLSDADFAASPYRRYRASALDEMRLWRVAGRLDYDVELGERLDLRTTLYRHDMSRSWRKFNSFGDGSDAAPVLDDPTRPRYAVYYDVLTGEADSSSAADQIVLGTNARGFFSQGLQSRLRHTVQRARFSNKLEAGARLHQDQIRRDHSEERFRMVAGTLQRTDEPESFPTRNTERSTALALWALDQIGFWRLTLTPGLRYESIWMRSEDRNAPQQPAAESTQSVLIPGAGAFFDLGHDVGLLAGVHRGFSPVTPGQSGQVQPETSVNYEAGARYDDKESSNLELIGFFNDYQNMLGACSFASGCLEQDLDDQFNAGQALIYGLEAIASHSVELGRPERELGLNLSYTFTRTELLNRFASQNPQLAEVEPGDELPYVPRHQAALRLGYSDARIEANLGATYIDAMREQAGQGPSGPRTDAYLSVDALLGVRVWRDLGAYFKGTNLLDVAPIASRRPYGARPISPRYLELGARLRWGGRDEENEKGAPEGAP